MLISCYIGHNSRRFVVPYAQAPTGANRFRDPLAPSTFKLYVRAAHMACHVLIRMNCRAYDASGLPPACPQPGLENISEDCLFLTWASLSLGLLTHPELIRSKPLSIYTPAGVTRASKLPVLFWVSALGDWADPTLLLNRLARRSTVDPSTPDRLQATASTAPSSPTPRMSLSSPFNIVSGFSAS